MRGKDVYRVILGAGSFILLANTAEAAQYTLTDLGTLGGTSSFGVAINNSGQVVGQASDGKGQFHAYLYSNGSMTNVGDWTPRAINNVGQIAGTDFDVACLYSAGVLQRLGALTPGASSDAYGINDLGQVVGFSQTGIAFEAFLYSNGSMQNLGSLVGANSWAEDINNSGMITGQANLSGFKTVGPTSTTIGVLAGKTNSIGFAINENGDVAGASGSSPGRHMVRFSNGVLQDLGVLPGTVSTTGQAINNAGQIVGIGEIDSFNTVAVGYLNGSLVNLNTLINPGSGWTLFSAWGINESGLITGSMSDGHGSTHAYILTPSSVPEPATLGVLGLPALGLLLRRSRRGDE